MKAREFTINVPINIKINGDGDPEIDVAGEKPEDGGAKPGHPGPTRRRALAGARGLRKILSGNRTRKPDTTI